MKMKKAILSCLMLMAGLSVSAQEQKGTTEYIFEPHWYFQIQGGVNYTTGEADFSKLISPNVQGAIGYNFNKALGLRLGLDAWQGKGGYKYTLASGEKQYDYKFTFFAPALDLTVNLANLINGIPTKWEYGLFAGIGANIRSKAADEVKTVRAAVEADSKTSGISESQMPSDWLNSKVALLGRAGAFVNYKITDQFSIGLEFNGNLLSDKFNFKDAGNPDSYFNLLAGIKYAFGPTYSTKFIPEPEPQIEYVEKIVEKVVEVPAPAPVIEPIRRDIFFLINKYDIRDSEKQKVQDIVDYMRANPASKVMITGYADAGTGNDKINDRLAAQRADAVVKALTETYGIPADRISYDSKGARVQPFTDNDSNRVSICIAE
ncbi:MAG: OmpA family protein [Prevotella sp.]|nr:OmpA family protein [Prevotella sp.]MBR0165878.1 OmpA family protein [Prevotella sp.]